MPTLTEPPPVEPQGPALRGITQATHRSGGSDCRRESWESFSRSARPGSVWFNLQGVKSDSLHDEQRRPDLGPVGRIAADLAQHAEVSAEIAVDG